MRDAVAPGGHELVGAGVGVGAGVEVRSGVGEAAGVGDGLGDGVAVAVGVAVKLGVGACEGDGEATATWAGLPAPPNGSTPRIGPVSSIPSAATTSTTAATVITGKPAFSDSAVADAVLSFARTVPLT
jgi:hypothetical protein